MTDSEATTLAVFALGGTVAVVMLVIAILMYVITCFGFAKMFKKAGEAGWKAFIPFYNTYILYKRCWNTKMFFVWLALDIVSGVISGAAENSVIFAILYLVVLVALIVIRALSYGRISKAYGNGIGTAVGFFFLPTIFSWIVGLGKAQYTKPEDVL